MNNYKAFPKLWLNFCWQKQFQTHFFSRPPASKIAKTKFVFRLFLSMKQSLSLTITFISVISILVAMTSGLISTYLVNNSLADYNANNRMLIAANNNSEDFENSLLVAETAQILADERTLTARRSA